MSTKRKMRLPKNSAYPNYNEVHDEDAWCAKVGCTPVCTPVSTEQEAGLEKPIPSKSQILKFALTPLF